MPAKPAGARSAMRFIERLGPSTKNGGFALDDHWVWDGSAIKGEDGRYHLFSSRWPKSYLMHPGWTFHSEIVHAISDTPEGPYRFEKVVFAKREAPFFDSRMTHNPTIHRHGDTFLLFYTGVGYAEDLSDPATIRAIAGDKDWYARYWNRKRIGLATSSSIHGPWKRPDAPILESVVGGWDETITSNPAPCVMADGSVYLIYKSNRLDQSVRGPFSLGLAHAKHWSGPFTRRSSSPLFAGNVEDPYLWHQDGVFHAIMKDMSGEICGESHGGIHATSPDALHWTFPRPCLGYSRTVTWDDGTVTKQRFRERPQVLIQDGVPTHLINATGGGSGTGTGFDACERTWTMVTPLRQGR